MGIPAEYPRSVYFEKLTPAQLNISLNYNTCGIRRLLAGSSTHLHYSTLQIYTLG